MNIDNRYNYAHAANWHDIENSFVPYPVESSETDVQDRHDAKDSFLKLVYAEDPVSHLPTGDLSYMVSDKANPEVKQWVLANLLMDVSSAAMPAAPKGLSDDDIASLARSPKESSQDYMNRINNFMRANVELSERLMADAKRTVPASDGEPAVSAE